MHSLFLRRITTLDIPHAKYNIRSKHLINYRPSYCLRGRMGEKNYFIEHALISYFLDFCINPLKLESKKERVKQNLGIRAITIFLSNFLSTMSKRRPRQIESSHQLDSNKHCTAGCTQKNHAAVDQGTDRPLRHLRFT